MAEKTLHEKLIDELLDPRSALSPREIAAKNEIQTLRERIDALTGADKKQEKTEESKKK